MPTVNPKQQPTSGFIKKPTPTPEQVLAKKNRPPGFCAAVAEQKVRIAQNKQARADFGRQGPSGRGEVSKLMSSSEMMFAMALIAVGMTSFGNAARAFGASIMGLFSAMPGLAAGTTREPAATVAGTGVAERHATHSKSSKRQPKSGYGGGTEGGGTAPRSAARPDLAPQPPLTRDQLRRAESLERGEAARDQAERLYGDRHVYDLLASFLTWKVGTKDDPRDQPGALDRIRKLNPAIGDFLANHHAGSTEFGEWRKRMGILGAETAGEARRADRADIAFQIFPSLAIKAEEWAKEQPVPTAGGPRPEAENEGGNGVRPNAANPVTDDQDPTYTLPAPGKK